MSKKDTVQIQSDIEGLFSGKILEKDDIGILDLAIEVGGSRKAYFISYYLELDTADINKIKGELKLTKGLLRHVFYKLGAREKFLQFKDINKMFEVTQEEKKLKENEKAFQDMDTISKIKK
ncbi:MAG: hypothetical protein V3575_02300 [Candidatus Absconditabacteria bacterium]